MERAKVLLQVQGQGGGEVKYKGVTDVLKHLYKEGGLRSIYRGTGATLARDGPGSAACALFLSPLAINRPTDYLIGILPHMR